MRTFNEFKCWLEGFTYSIRKRPTINQWNLIKEKLASIYPNDDFIFPIKATGSENIRSEDEINQIPLIAPSTPLGVLKPDGRNEPGFEQEENKTACL